MRSTARTAFAPAQGELRRAPPRMAGMHFEVRVNVQPGNPMGYL